MTGDCYLIALSGEIDESAKDELRSYLRDFRRSSSRHAAVDLYRVRFLGSEAIDFIGHLQQAARGRGGTLTLINASPAVIRFLKITEWDMVLQERRFSPPP